MVSRKKILSRSRDALDNVAEVDPPPVVDPDVWKEPWKLVKDHIDEVVKKWHSIDDEIWAKIIVMEENRRVAKAYARAPVITVNGSDDGFDGFRIGLSGFNNPAGTTNPSHEEIKKSVGQGCKIKMDDCGNILVKRISDGNVFVKRVLLNNNTASPNSTNYDSNEYYSQLNLTKSLNDLNDVDQPCKADDYHNIHRNEEDQQEGEPRKFCVENNETTTYEKDDDDEAGGDIVPSLRKNEATVALEFDKPFKLFDMTKFQSRISHELKQSYPDRRKLEMSCVCALAFVLDGNHLLDTPCWLMVINVVAMDMLRNKLPPAADFVMGMTSPFTPFVRHQQVPPAGYDTSSTRPNIKNRPGIPIPTRQQSNIVMSSSADTLMVKQDSSAMIDHYYHVEDGKQRTKGMGNPPNLPPPRVSTTKKNAFREQQKHTFEKLSDDANSKSEINMKSSPTISRTLAASKSNRGKDKHKKDDPYYCGLRARVPQFVSTADNNASKKASVSSIQQQRGLFQHTKTRTSGNFLQEDSRDHNDKNDSYVMKTSCDKALAPQRRKGCSNKNNSTKQMLATNKKNVVNKSLSAPFLQDDYLDNPKNSFTTNDHEIAFNAINSNINNSHDIYGRFIGGNSSSSQNFLFTNLRHVHMPIPYPSTQANRSCGMGSGNLYGQGGFHLAMATKAVTTPVYDSRNGYSSQRFLQKQSAFMQPSSGMQHAKSKQVYVSEWD